LLQYSSRKDDKSKIRRKKNNSMENLAILAVKEPPRMVLAREPREIEIKRKIMGMKEQIKKEKELLIKRT